MKHLILLFCLVFAPFAVAADNAQLVQTNVNVQNKVEATNNVDQPSAADVDKDASSVAVQQDVVAVQQKEEAPPPPQPAQPQQPNGPPPQQPAANAQSVQLLKEANSQYQYQINSRYEEKTRPVYGEPVAVSGQQYVGQAYPYVGVVGYPYYRENNHYQELGNGQRRTESNVAVNDGSQFENQDRSTYTHQRSQSYSEYGKGESSPDYNTYAYKRMYY